ncbi:MAG TPA: hypothetical protein VIH90_07025 [Candidatus Saccharimonadales bacterium]
MAIGFLGEDISTLEGKDRFVKFYLGFEEQGVEVPAEFSIKEMATRFADDGMSEEVLDMVDLYKQDLRPGVRRMALQALAPLIDVYPEFSYSVIIEGLQNPNPYIREVTGDFLVGEFFREKRLDLYRQTFGVRGLRDIVAARNNADLEQSAA